MSSCHEDNKVSPLPEAWATAESCGSQSGAALNARQFSVVNGVGEREELEIYVTQIKMA